MDWDQAAATGHVLAALSALAAGAAVLVVPKGEHTHRLVGAGYVLALVLANAAALSLSGVVIFGRVPPILDRMLAQR